MLQFLRPRRHEVDGDRVLVVQSGEPALAVRLVEHLRARFPRSELSMLVRKGTDTALPPLPGVEIIQNEGPRPTFVRRLQAARFDRVYVLLSGDPGPWKLKLLPFALGAEVVFAVNENLGYFEVSVESVPTLARHLRWRYESSLSHAGPAGARTLTSIARAATYPALLAYLLAWEQLRNRAARSRGARDWKRENRPAAASGKREAA
jgi:hypothetical protein